MDIKHSRRLLAVGAPNSGVLAVIRDLTGSAPNLNENGSTAGLTHEWDVHTPYYTAKVPIWVDEIPNAEAWKNEFLKPEAKEVVDAVGAWIYCFRMPRNGTVSEGVENILKAIQDVSEEHAGYAADVVMLAVAVPHSKGATSAAGDAKHDEWEDMCLQYGFEYIDYSGQGQNEFREKTGFERLKEALEANEWAAAPTDEADLDVDNLDFGDEIDENDIHDWTRDEAEMTAELFGMKTALTGDDEVEPDGDGFVPPSQQAGQVEDLDRLMGRLLAVKEQSADLPEAKRKALAAQAVRDLMKENHGV